MIRLSAARTAFVASMVLLVVGNVAMGAFPHRWGWRLGWNAHDMSWTGWPYRFIEYGGYFSHYELDWLAFGKSVVAWSLLSLVAALVIRGLSGHVRPSDGR